MDIIAKYEHSKYGNFMFKLCAKWTKFIVKHKWLYYLLQFTWGILLTVAGLLVDLVLLVIGYHFEVFYWMTCVNVGPKYWGGLSLGLTILRDHASGISYINNHELGHSAQAVLLGPLAIFLVTIPSACRYWYQTIRARHKKENKPYDSFWAEDSATQCGNYIVQYLNIKELED